MKTVLLAFAIWMAFNNSAGPGGNLLSNVPDNLTTQPYYAGNLFAR